MSPPFKTSPTFTFIVTSHNFSTPDCSAIACKGRSIPSKIFLKIPGPNVTQIGDPVEITGSPGFKPVVVSYTWIVVKSLEIEITSPINFA